MDTSVESIQKHLIAFFPELKGQMRTEVFGDSEWLNIRLPHGFITLEHRRSSGEFGISRVGGDQPDFSGHDEVFAKQEEALRAVFRWLEQETLASSLLSEGRG